jgi:hypothetical protein
MTMRIGRLQGLYYLTTGLWPVIDIASFERVTGPKTDKWLVRTMGGLIAAIGADLVRHPDHAGVGAGAAAVLGVSETWYVARGRISRIYLADALVSAALVTAWLSGAPRRRRGPGSPFRVEGRRPSLPSHPRRRAWPGDPPPRPAPWIW